ARTSGNITVTDPKPPRTSPLSLHDALPISSARHRARGLSPAPPAVAWGKSSGVKAFLRCAPPVLPAAGKGRGSLTRVQNVAVLRSEEHTSELQSRSDLVCRLLLEKQETQVK